MGKNEVKQFTTASKKKKSKDVRTFPTTVDGREIVFREPDKTDFAVFTMTSEDNPHLAIVRFLEGCMEPADRRYISRRLTNPDDEFGIDEITDIFNWFTGEIAGRPTGS